MNNVGAVATLLHKIADIWNKRPSRLKEQALQSALKYIDINETGEIDGKKLSVSVKKKWLRHYRKQVESWSDGM